MVNTKPQNIEGKHANCKKTCTIAFFFTTKNWNYWKLPDMVDFNKKWSIFERSKIYWISCLCLKISDLKLTVQHDSWIKYENLQFEKLPFCLVALWFLVELFSLSFISIHFSLNFISFYFPWLLYFNLFFSHFAIAILVSMSNGGGRFSGFDSCLNNLATFVILSTLGRGRGRSVWKTPRIS